MRVVLLGVTVVEFLPVENVPQLDQVINTAILIIEVIGMLPHIEGENGFQASPDGVAGIGFLNDVEFALGIGSQPHPT